MRDIRSILKRNPELAKYFIESTYISSRGKCYPRYRMDNMGVDIINNRYRFNIRSARFEYKYLNEIQDFFDAVNIEYILQYQVGNYRIDLYIPKFNLAIEIDEKEHKYKQDYDRKR